MSHTYNNSIAPHEALELRELVSSQMVGVKKLQASINMVKDAELKGFMQAVVDSKVNSISELESFIQGSTVSQ